MIKVHLDTDLGGDIDDICALAFLLRSPEVEITGITIVGDTNGSKTGYTRYVLALEGRDNIPVAAGADTSQGYYRSELGIQGKDYWPALAIASPNPPGEAIELLKNSIEQGAIIIGIGPYTNLSLLEKKYTGILKQARLYLMGGYVDPPNPKFSKWTNKDDFNIQIDIESAKHVLVNSNPVLVPLTVTVETALRKKDLTSLRQAGSLGELLVRQAEAFAKDEQFDIKFSKAFGELPSDLINFQHDPLTCAIALGWNKEVEIKKIKLVIQEKDGYLYEKIDELGQEYKIVTKIDGSQFNKLWLDTITKA